MLEGVTKFRQQAWKKKLPEFVQRTIIWFSFRPINKHRTRSGHRREDINKSEHHEAGFWGRIEVFGKKMFNFSTTFGRKFSKYLHYIMSIWVINLNFFFCVGISRGVRKAVQNGIINFACSAVWNDICRPHGAAVKRFGWPNLARWFVVCGVRFKLRFWGEKKYIWNTLKFSSRNGLANLNNQLWWR